MLTDSIIKKSRTWKLAAAAVVICLVIGLAFWAFGNIKNSQGLERNTLAVVNNTKITKQDFDERWKQMPEEMKSAFKEDREGFLENLILIEMLYQEAKQQGIAVAENGGKEAKEQAVQELAYKVASTAAVTDTEIRSFYDKNADKVNGVKFEDIRAEIKEYLLTQKQDAAVEAFIAEIKAKTTIIKNEDWLKEQRRKSADNPFTKAVNNGRPTVLDLGSNSCVPCKMMKPILDELDQEYRNKANVLVLEIGDYRDLARQYKVRVMPTQIFFDKSGNEYWRHEGFLAKEEIQAKLKELGVE
ncbi:thioredoxin domain-containing protein [Pelosinus sp. IPA-1]|uniref:thioredoxin domain-containing protein n=1 Tax=Pelosinus sp. IPA-1 TaxID=3029569 RepID=UPI0024361C89|nr:thioredoxin domain-containing protein [Pelosinus sp. IPA-1]GMB00989.1 hypothetical protein PIPA1_37880 [Pelosinus sp. IPA-1]